MPPVSSVTAPANAKSGLQPVRGAKSVPSARSLREFRFDRQLSLRDLAAASGINRGTLSQIEQGKRLPEPAQLQALAGALGISVDSWRIRLVLETEAR